MAGIVRLSSAKTANAERRLVVCRSVRDVCLFKLPDDTAELGTSVRPRAGQFVLIQYGCEAKVRSYPDTFFFVFFLSLI